MMTSNYLDDTRSLERTISDKARDLFKAKPGHSALKVTRVFGKNNKDDGGKAINCFEKDKDVWNISELKALQSHLGDSSQTFVIRQDRSWTTLNISREIFQAFMSTHNVMPPFWRHVFTFGRKIEEHEFEFPGISQRRTRNMRSTSMTYEIAYTLRRAEPNGREDTEGKSTWSIRQTAVYHKLAPKSLSLNTQSGNDNLIPTPEEFKSTFLLISPSSNVEWQFEECLDQSILTDTPCLSPWNTHRILFADSLRGWSEYMAILEHRLKEQSDRIMLATVGNDDVKLSPLTDFNINFEDRQELKIVEDKILDLQVILPGMLSTISGVQETCKQHCKGLESMYNERYELDAIIGEFDEYIKESRMQIDRAKALRDMAKSTARLLSDLLSYEEAVALKQLQIETQLESRSMCHLTERSMKDAAAVKILTVITLVYLPTTIVANFFSTQFVQTNDKGKMQVSTNAWLLAAISVPLTVATILLWWLWVHFTTVKPTISVEQPGVVTLQRQHSFRSIVSSKKKQHKGDLEIALGSLPDPRNAPLCHTPSSFQHKAGVTWSSTATTIKP